MSNTPGYYQYYRKEMRPLLPSRYARVLEIGCGEGNFRENLSGEHEYWGVEPVAASAEVAAKKLDKVFTGTYQAVAREIPDGYFDLIICNDVIEHMVDHDAFLQAIKEKMRGDGWLVASVPNVRYLENLIELLFGKDWEYKEAGILDRTHLRFFTQKSLVRALRDNGFVVDEFMGINPCMPGSRLRRLLYSCLVFLLGRDVRFLQFGVRARVG